MDDDESFEIEEIITTIDSQGEETEDDNPDENDDNASEPEPSTPQRREIKWKRGEFRPFVHPFDDANSGFRSEFCNINDASNFVDYFKCFVTPELTSKIAFETNR